MRIALDAMGGDHAPAEIVKGAVQAARELSGLSKVYLVGDESRIKAELALVGRVPAAIEIRHASEVVGMDELPAQAVRRKRDSSIGRATELVSKGEADAVVSAGNTGAAVVAATLRMRTLNNVTRPAIATVFPTHGRPLVLLDAGANTDCDADLLVQFAVMGSVYANKILGQENPLVGLVSIGGEEVKGNEITKETFKRLTDSPLNFKGNVEGHDMFVGETDVAVCDGFVGNIILKTSESVSHAIGSWLKDEMMKNPARMLGALLMRGAFKGLKRRLDPELYGGAPLLGVNGICIITHGGSSAKAIYNAIRVATEAVEQKLNHYIAQGIAEIHGES